VEVEPESWIDWNADLASVMVETLASPILMSHAPFTRVRQFFIFAAGVLGDIVARWRQPPDSRRLRPAVTWVAMSNLQRSSGCSNAS